ncbi:hypothetical protein D9758_015537 [Tetrapyrgos nigripes]|uniref:Phosphoglycerate mutase n=1 Tax=Tetrapyrgos nigripes TaxID=182062 RepID=A0A8H5C3E2_9AGAR|nr:hypothetical protein D9758_015537 [Tetrapyrgos nigripes]
MRYVVSQAKVLLSKSISIQAVSGFFLQDNCRDPASLGALPPRFGLIDESPERWSNLQSKISQMNRDPSRNEDSDGLLTVFYKVIFFGRHGQGWHNVGEAKYGTEAWDNYWSKLNGDGEIIWGPDPELTALGEEQARAASNAWRAELSYNIPVPNREARLCSPMTRAVKTHLLTFDFEDDEKEGKKKAIIVENCREVYGEHTCDKRRSKTFLLDHFPQFEIEGGISADSGVFTDFTEDDELWVADERETEVHLAARAEIVLDRIFGEELKGEDFISVTAHGGIINGFLNAMGRDAYSLPTGGVLPVVVRSTVTAS